MAETLVENRICSACGAEVRRGALFCYNCGGAVAPEMPATAEKTEINQPPTIDVFRDALVEEKLVAEKPVTENPEPSEQVLAERAETAEAAAPLDAPVDKPDVVEEAKLKSAASLRRKPKTVQKRKVEEVVWTGHENAPNAWFIFVAVVLTLLALGIFWLAMYLK
jgi:hypothetical protein